MRQKRIFLAAMMAVMALGAAILPAGVASAGSTDTGGTHLRARAVHARLAGSSWPGGRTFRAVWALDNGQVRPIVAGTSIRVTFDVSHRLTVRAGCNTMTGRGGIRGGRLAVSNLASTRMFCGQPRMEQERWVRELITSRPYFYLVGHRLILHHGWGVTELRFSDVQPPWPLSGD